jgi:hypothetical protein
MKKINNNDISRLNRKMKKYGNDKIGKLVKKSYQEEIKRIKKVNDLEWLEDTYVSVLL